ncbi:MAG: ComEC/Rec2 family competence protein, partial [Candidatus Omnitrophica bacterium]|nr:ComEC/Rec2 family competence protein [Candidatus Omnitrophota bacterium]
AVLIVLTPIIAHYFNLFSPVTFIANMVLIPLSFVLLSLSFLAALLGVHIGHWLWFDVRFVEIVFIWLADKLAGIPGGAWYVPRPPPWLAAAYYVFLIILLTAYSPHCRRIPRFLILWFFFVTLLFWFPLLPKTSHALEVTFFDVGHGDAALVEFPRGETLLIDTGRETQPNPSLHPVLTYLRMKGIRFLDGVVLSHADKDHMGGFDFIQKQIRVARLWDNGYDDSAASLYRRAFTSLERYQTLTQGDRLATLSGISLECLGPRQDWLSRCKQRNDASIVLKLEMGRRSVLFTGDVEGIGVQTLTALAPEQLSCTFLKVPHHGSDLGPGGAIFFAHASPRTALISMAVPNPWNLPAVSTLRQLTDCGAEVLVTAQTGAVCFRTDGGSYDLISLSEERNLWYTLPIQERRSDDDGQKT